MMFSWQKFKLWCVEAMEGGTKDLMVKKRNLSKSYPLGYSSYAYKTGGEWRKNVFRNQFPFPTEGLEFH